MDEIVEVRVFFDTNIIDYLYNILDNGGKNIPSVDPKELDAIKNIWDDNRFVIVTTNALYIEVMNGRKNANDLVKAKINKKIELLIDCKNGTSTALYYGEGSYGEGRFGMPIDYEEYLKLFKKTDNQSARRDVQHLINCHDNKIKWLLTKDVEFCELGKKNAFHNSGVTVQKPSEFLREILDNGLQKS